MVKRIITGKVHGGKVLEGTDRDTTLYVRTTGDDSNDGLSVATAFRHPQSAIDVIPTVVDHDVVIDVGEGTFNGIDVSVRNFGGSGSLTISGVLGTPTLSGATAGTGGVGSDTYQIVDATAGWTVDELKGKLILVDGAYRAVYSNTATTAQFVGVFGATTNGQAYAIVEQKTVVNSVAASPISPPACALFTNITSSRSTALVVQDIRFDGGTAGAVVGVFCYASLGGIFRRCDIHGAVYGFFTQNCAETNLYETTSHDNTNVGVFILKSTTVRYMENVFSYDNGNDGIYIHGTLLCNGQWLAASGNSGSGVNVDLSMWFDIDGGQLEDNGAYGLRVGLFSSNMDGNVLASAIAPTGRLKLGGNTLGGINVEAHSVIYVGGATGTAAGGCGVTCSRGSVAYIKSDVDVTGPSGDATVNDGTTVLGWTTHFATDGDSAVNTDTGDKIIRKD